MTSTTVEIEQLLQISKAPIWDGHILSKETRDALCRSQLVGRTMGYNFLTELGIEYCVNLGLLRS
jgi:hypothetical protein